MEVPLFRKLDDSDAGDSALSVTVDGQAVSAEAGDSIAAVLLRLDPPRSRTTPVKASARAPYCMMGVCFECLAVVDGVASTQTCMTEVQQGMRIERQHGRLDLGIACSEPGDVDADGARSRTANAEQRP